MVLCACHKISFAAASRSCKAVSAGQAACQNPITSGRSGHGISWGYFALAHYAARRRRGELIATSFVESAVAEIIAWHMAKRQQMLWSRATVQPFLDVRTAVLNDILEQAFQQRHPGFRPADDDHNL